MKKILHINGCIRGESSRTLRLARAFLDKQADAEIEELDLLQQNLKPMDATLLAKRDQLIGKGQFDDPLFKYARQFAAADEIVLSAPYWDLSFPSLVRTYWERVSVCGLTFSYSPEGIPVGHCKATRLTYITTAGGYLGKYNHGFDYVSDLCHLYFGIKQVECIAAEGLDIIGNDAEAILQTAIQKL